MLLYLMSPQYEKNIYLIYHAHKKFLPLNPISVSDIYKILNEIDLTASIKMKILYRLTTNNLFYLFTCHEIYNLYLDRK